MSMPRETAPENSASGRGLRSYLDSVTSFIARLLTSSREPARSKRGRSHLGRQRALRLSALLAPRNRLRAGAAGLALASGLLIGVLLSRNVEQLPLSNAIWLDRTWVYSDIDEARLGAYLSRMKDHRIGKAYAYVSSLGIGDRWLGGAQGATSFMNTRGTVEAFVKTFKDESEQIELLAWLEIWTHLDNVDSYRLDDSDLHQNIADFSRFLVEQLGFDGVLLDVKPLFVGNDDYIRLIRRVRAAVGADKTIAVAVTADLTPHDLRPHDIPFIAPGTMWPPDIKQRVLEAADEVVLLMYQSYRQKTLDYVNWVAYHVETYVNLLETSTEILVSIPNYGGASNAHNPTIETMANAMDGVREGMRRLDDAQRGWYPGLPYTRMRR